MVESQIIWPGPLIGFGIVTYLLFAIPFTWGVKVLPVFLVLDVAAAVVFFRFYLKKRSRARDNHKREVAEALATLASQRLAVSVADARELTDRISSFRDSYFVRLGSLKDILRRADVSLEKARHEYEDGAFAPFWDNIEDAATALAEFKQALDPPVA
jgi:hypothetical protein